eukprot:8378624-Pyramimonas_sp.AAC.1
MANKTVVKATAPAYAEEQKHITRVCCRVNNRGHVDIPINLVMTRGRLDWSVASRWKFGRVKTPNGLSTDYRP